MFNFKTIFVFTGAMSLLASSGDCAPSSPLTDAQFLAVARCDGLANAKALGTEDAAAFDALFQSEGVRRTPDIFDRADDARAEAFREASRAGPTARLSLIAERDGVCQTYLRSAGGGVDASGASHSNTH